MAGAKIGYDEVQPAPFQGSGTSVLSDTGSWVSPEVIVGVATGVNLNAVAATALATIAIPTGFSGFVPTRVIRYKDSIAATTASISFGQTATPTDFAATATNANATAAKSQIITATAALQPFYTAGSGFVVNVTIAQGAGATANFALCGYYVV
jgi:hypothetical protein